MCEDGIFLSMKYALKMPLQQFKFDFWIFISSGLIFFISSHTRCLFDVRMCVFWHLFTQ